MSDGLADWQECFYCKLRHKSVEGGGLWYCPNRLCSGPGPAGWRSTLPSYKSNEDATYSLDPQEALIAAIAELKDQKDEAIKKATLACVTKWLK